MVLNHIGKKTGLKFTGTCLKEDKITFTHKAVVNMKYEISYEISVSARRYDDYPTLENCLFDAFRLTKNADIDRYKYSGYGIGFNRRGTFSFPCGGFGCNVLIFGVDMKFSVHADNKKKYILILGEDPT